MIKCHCILHGLMKCQMRCSIVKAFAISHASCSLIPTLFVPPAWLKACERAVLGRLGFTEALEMFRCLCYLPCIESRAELTPPPRPHLVDPRLYSTARSPLSSGIVAQSPALRVVWAPPSLGGTAAFPAPSLWTALPTCSPQSWLLRTSTAASYSNGM